MSYYKFSPELSYQEFLKQKKYYKADGVNTPSAVMEVSQQTLNVIADVSSLAFHEIVVLASHPGLPTNPHSDAIPLAYKICDTGKINAELSPKFRWDFADCIFRIGNLNERLSLLIDKLDSPVQILAYNQFEKAREAFAAKKYSFALEEVNKAIYGGQTSAGFQSEWRFYMLQGVIYLGFYDFDPDLIDLSKAEEVFTHAALFAYADYPSDAAVAYLAAGWAVYCQGKIDLAIEHSNKALELDSKLSEAHYLIAKYYLSMGKVKEAFNTLTKAIHQDPFYSLKAAGDLSYHEYELEYREYLISLKQALFEKFRKRVSDEVSHMRLQTTPPELQEIINKYSNDKPLLKMSKAEAEWNIFKVRPIFSSKKIENLKIEHDTIVEVIEPYREKVVLKPKTLFRKEEFKIVTKTRVAARKKTIRYNVDIIRDAFTFFNGKVLVDYEMVHVPGNKYDMGDTNSIGRSDEKPIQKVELSSFMICRILVTQKLWNLVMVNNPSNFQGYELPVEHVSWYDCLEFCNKLSEMAGLTPYYTIDREGPDPTNQSKSDNKRWTITCKKDANGYRLPTEAEWEFAAKGGMNDNSYRYAGSDLESIVAWDKDNSSFTTHPVAQKKPNEIGLYDMSGNVWEWCWDWYDSYSDKEFVNPLGAEKGSYKVIRGGSWADNRNYIRVASRGKENPSGKYSSIGVRIARNYIKPDSK